MYGCWPILFHMNIEEVRTLPKPRCGRPEIDGSGIFIFVDSNRQRSRLWDISTTDRSPRQSLTIDYDGLSLGRGAAAAEFSARSGGKQTMRDVSQRISSDCRRTESHMPALQGLTDAARKWSAKHVGVGCLDGPPTVAPQVPDRARVVRED